MSSISWLRRFACAACSLVATGFAACDAGSDVSVTPGEPGTVDNNVPGQTALAIRFEAAGDRSTSCGSVEGIHVAIADAAGAKQVCDASWAPATVSGGMADGATGEHLVADCLFVVAPGSLSVQNIAAVDGNGNELACCDASYPNSVVVAESTTTEFGAEINCQTVQSGGLDIYAFMNRPPVINNIKITPSKFGRTCDVISLEGLATDPDGDGVTYSWSIDSAPRRADVALRANGAVAHFSAATMGDYAIKLTASDQSLAHELTFPLHITSPGACNDGLTTAERVEF